MSRLSDLDALLTSLGDTLTVEEMEYAIRDYQDREVRTVLANRAAAGGGGAGLTVTVTLDNDQIKALPTTPVEIIAPTETLGYSGIPATLPLPVAATAVMLGGATPYGNIDAAVRMLLAWGADWSRSASEIVTKGVPAPAAVLGLLSTPAGNKTLAAFGGPDVDSGGYLAGSFQDNGLYLAISNGALGVLTDGDAATTLWLEISYRILALP